MLNGSVDTVEVPVLGEETGGDTGAAARGAVVSGGTDAGGATSASGEGAGMTACFAPLFLTVPFVTEALFEEGSFGVTVAVSSLFLTAVSDTLLIVFMTVTSDSQEP